MSRQRVRSGFESVADTAALASVGFEPVCEVIGAVVNSGRPMAPRDADAAHWVSNANATPHAASGRSARHAAASGRGRYVRFDQPADGSNYRRVHSLNFGYRTMLDRLLAEAEAAGADGVVGIRFDRTVSRLGKLETWEFLATGTAVRSTGAVHPSQPFSTDLPGAGVAAAVRAGWQPLRLVIAPSRAIRVLGAVTRWQRLPLGRNAEVTRYTDVIAAARHTARQNFAVGAGAADGAVLSNLSVTVETDLKDGLCVASALAVGTSLVQFAPPSTSPSPLMIIPLNRGAAT